MAKKKPAKVRRYLSNLYRGTEYYPADDESSAHHCLQIFEGIHWIGTYKGESMQVILHAVRDSGVEIIGESYLDYLMPRNALEKTMLDEIMELRRIVSESVGLADLQRMGYDVDTGRALLKRCEDHNLETDAD